MEIDNYVKLFVHEKVNIVSELNYDEIKIFNYIMYFVKEITCVLNKEDNSMLTINDISEALELDINHVEKIMKSLKKKEVVVECVEEFDNSIIGYIMNPYICMKGDRVYTKLVDIFCETRWAKRFDEND